MDVGGTIDVILNSKSGEIYSIAHDATVFEAGSPPETWSSTSSRARAPPSRIWRITSTAATRGDFCRGRCPRRQSRDAAADSGYYSRQTVFPAMIVRAARPFNFQPWKGEL